MPGHVSFDFEGTVAVVTGAAGSLGSAVVEGFLADGASVAAIDVVAAAEATAVPDAQQCQYYQCDLTDEPEVSKTFEAIVDDYDGIDVLANIAGTWRGGDPLHETADETFDLLFDVNLRTMFLASKHAMPHLRDAEGAIVSVASRSSLEGGEGDGLYRASKAGVRLLTESIAEEQLGSVRANAVMPSVIDTPANREMMPDADHDAWVDPTEIAAMIRVLATEEAGATSGAAIPVFGEA